MCSNKIMHIKYFVIFFVRVVYGFKACNLPRFNINYWSSDVVMWFLTANKEGSFYSSSQLKKKNLLWHGGRGPCITSPSPLGVHIIYIKCSGLSMNFFTQSRTDLAIILCVSDCSRDDFAWIILATPSLMCITWMYTMDSSNDVALSRTVKCEKTGSIFFFYVFGRFTPKM